MKSEQHSAIASFRLNGARQLPQNETLSRSISRQRQLPSANWTNQLARQTDRGEKFLLDKDKQLIVFTRAWNLWSCKHCFTDGTLFFIESISTLHGLFKWRLVYGWLRAKKNLQIINDFFNLLWKKMTWMNSDRFRWCNNQSEHSQRE